MDDFLSMDAGHSPSDDLGKELSISKPVTQGLPLDFKKLNKSRKEFEEKVKMDRISTIIKVTKILRVKPKPLLDWVGTDSNELSPEKEIMFQNKQIKSTRFKCNGSRDFAGATSFEKIPMESDSNEVEITQKIKPKKCNICTNLETRFSGLVASPLNQDTVVLHAEEH